MVVDWSRGSWLYTGLAYDFAMLNWTSSVKLWIKNRFLLNNGYYQNSLTCFLLPFLGWSTAMPSVQSSSLIFVVIIFHRAKRLENLVPPSPKLYRFRWIFQHFISTLHSKSTYLSKPWTSWTTFMNSVHCDLWFSWLRVEFQKDNDLILYFCPTRCKSLEQTQSYGNVSFIG